MGASPDFAYSKVPNEFREIRIIPDYKKDNAREGDLSEKIPSGVNRCPGRSSQITGWLPPSISMSAQAMVLLLSGNCACHFMRNRLFIIPHGLNHSTKQHFYSYDQAIQI